MSLKAKIEAVIYASEEPVTLQQLTGLLGQEAQLELDAADARQGQLPLPEEDALILVQETEAGDPDALNAETLGVEVFEAVAPPEDTGLDTENPEEPDAEPTTQETAPGPGQDPAELTAAEQRTRDRRVREFMRSLLDALITEYRTADRGLEIREVAGGFRFATKPEYHDAVRGFVRSLKPPLKLTLQALETLAVVAYKQPVTAPEVSEIRGVDSGGVLGSLMARKLVATAGRKQVIGRPILYKTTKEFLLRFGLKDVGELPSIEEFERLASQMNEAVQEEIPMAETLDQMRPSGAVGDAARNVEPMRDVHAAQADGVPDQEADAEHTAPLPDEPSEFTGDATAPPADNAAVDGRISGVPPSYDEPGDTLADSPALDAEVQANEQLENTGSDD